MYGDEMGCIDLEWWELEETTHTSIYGWLGIHVTSFSNGRLRLIFSDT
jgi:hypothetical protein